MHAAGWEGQTNHRYLTEMLGRVRGYLMGRAIRSRQFLCLKALGTDQLWQRANTNNSGRIRGNFQT